jgi:hypothetical protein
MNQDFFEKEAYVGTKDTRDIVVNKKPQKTTYYKIIGTMLVLL